VTPNPFVAAAVVRRSSIGATWLVVALALGGCSFASEALWPSLTGGDPRGSATAPASPAAAQRREIPPSTAERTGQPVNVPVAGARSAQAPSAPSIGVTAVGQRAQQMRDEVQRLQAGVGARNSTLRQLRDDSTATALRYHGQVGAINARLQIGTTPGNPILQAQWNEASQDLDRIGAEIGRLAGLSNQVAADAATAAFLLDSTRAAYNLSGAIEDDHRALALVEDEVNRTTVTIDRMLNELSEDVSRQSAYIARERANLTALSVAIKNGELYGQGLANRAFQPLTPPVAGTQPSAGASTTSPANPAQRRPLVVIRFDRTNPVYEQALYTAVSRALEREPNTQFDVVGIAPSRGNQGQVALASANAKRQAETVFRSLTDMGLPQDRVRLSQTTSAAVASNEVHLFLR
jgi:hypothetical protein